MSAENTARGFVHQNYDSFNSETFGSTQAAAESNNWMSNHNAFVSSLSTDTTSSSTSTEEEVHSERIKGLWPSSPAHPSTPNDSIWSSPDLPSRSQHLPSAIIGSPSVPTGPKIMTVEELEREYSSPSPSSSETTPISQPLAPPPGLRMPRPVFIPSHPIGQNLPLRLPPHHLFSPPRGVPQRFPPGFPLPPRQHLRGFPPPRQGPLLPPSAFHRPQPRMIPPHWPLQQSEVTPRKSRRSEYLDELKRDGSGFMTQKEKEWVVKIQLIQLQSADPSNDDYYYMNYIRRKQARNQSDIPSSDQPDQSEDSKILALPNIAHEERKYKPAEFAGTLGKLSVLSLGAPRKKLDVSVAPGGDVGKDGGVVRKKQAFIAIEKLYVMLLDLEETESKALALSGEERSSLLTHRDQVRTAIMALLQLKEGSSKSELALFHQVITIRKGKRLVKRVLPLLSDEQSKIVLIAILQNLSTIIKKDTDQILPELRTCVKAVISTFDLSSVTQSLRVVLEGGLSSGSGLVRIAQNEFGAGVLTDVLMRGTTLFKSGNRLNQDDRDVETWYQQCSELERELFTHSEQLAHSIAPHTSALLSTLATHSV